MPLALCDNKSAIRIALDPNHQEKTKPIEIKWHFIKEKLDIGLITTTYILFGLQLAYLLTKGFPTKLYNMIEMMDIHSLSFLVIILSTEFFFFDKTLLSF